MTLYSQVWLYSDQILDLTEWPQLKESEKFGLKLGRPIFRQKHGEILIFYNILFLKSTNFFFFFSWPEMLPFYLWSGFM